MTDLFDTVIGGNPSTDPEPAALETVVEEKNQVLAEEEGETEPEELAGATAEDGTTEEGEEGNADDESDENAAGDEVPAAVSETASTATSQPAPQKPVNVVEEDVYEFEKCLITVTMGLMPNDGDPNGRVVMLGVRNHQDEPLFTTCRLNDLAPLPDPIQQLLKRLKEQLPARSEKAARKKARVKEEEQKRKTANSKTKPTQARLSHQRPKSPSRPA